MILFNSQLAKSARYWLISSDSTWFSMYTFMTCVAASAIPVALYWKQRDTFTIIILWVMITVHQISGFSILSLYNIAALSLLIGMLGRSSVHAPWNTILRLNALVHACIQSCTATEYNIMCMYSAWPCILNNIVLVCE